MLGGLRIPCKRLFALDHLGQRTDCRVLMIGFDLEEGLGNELQGMFVHYYRMADQLQFMVLRGGSSDERTQQRPLVEFEGGSQVPGHVGIRLRVIEELQFHQARRHQKPDGASQHFDEQAAQGLAV
ncbi:hypothetical protein D3C72_2090900 [compost metagenome]